MEETFKLLWNNLAIIGGMLSPFVFKLLQSKKFRLITLKFIKAIFFNMTSRDYRSHHFYNNLMYHRSLSGNIKFECNKKNELFKIMSSNTINSTELQVTRWIELHNRNLKKLSKVELRGHLMDLLDNISIDVAKKSSDAFYTFLEDRKLSNKMFDIIYNGHGNIYGYKEYMQSNNKHIDRYIKNIPNYENESNYYIFSMFMSHLDVILSSGIHDLKEGFDAHNGRLCK